MGHGPGGRMTSIVVPRPEGFAHPRPALLDWLTTVDHKKLGILYLYTTMFFFGVGGVLALLVRTQLAVADNSFVSNDAYNQIFTMHASAMLFLFIIPVWAGFGNYVVPLQIGAADMAFPRINALSFWLVPPAGILMFSGFLVDGGAAQAGWTAYSPLARGLGPGMDLWIIAVILLGISSTIGAANFMVTMFRMRAPGMTMFRMPIFCWTMLVTAVLQLLATPVLASALAMLYIDRNFGGAFFDPNGGGNAILWQNIFWFYSHPAVYIMILPGMGIISEVLPVFSRKPLFGYTAFVFATMGIGGLGFSVWAHHMFTTGAVLKPWFGFMTFMIGVPTGVKMFNWLGTMWRGSISFEAPMLFALGFLSMFLIGGINGTFSAAVPVDFALHDTYFVVAHIHYVLFGGSVFAVFAGLYYWFPKIWGRRLNERLGQAQFWLMFIGFNLTFFPMHLLGLDGMPRRIATYSNESGWEALNLASTVGAFLIATSMIPFTVAVVAAFMRPKDQPNDPWNANTLEWWTTSPPPVHNFDDLPEVHSERPLFDARHGGAGH
ncbi:MAG: cytochrome c oxidase subunit I [Chloroflexi bacterium]|nr:cytochrome c oxidase subunit I [Chloroflexota bacterium]PWB45209.1 MAG: cytochrome c oxidase subunit I [Dehalococcoidia bacterium]